MDDEQDLSGISVVRLFPLAGVAFFPHSILPLHIFEPRYRQMTQDALESDDLITIVGVRPVSEWEGSDVPRLEEYGCVGRIVKHELLEDGRYNFLLLGLRRVRLVEELAVNKLYRMAEVEVMDDQESDEDEAEALRNGLTKTFREYVAGLGSIDPDLEEVISSNLPLGVLADILSHALDLPVALKQRLVAEVLVSVRVHNLRAWLEASLVRAKNPRPSPPGYPPPFSRN